MLKKLIILAILIASAVLSFGVGVLNFSKENLNNVTDGAVSKSFSEGDGMELVGWTLVDGKYVSGHDSQIVIQGVDTDVRNIRLAGELFDEALTVEIFYTQSPDEVFTSEKCVISPVTKKNDDIYFNLDMEVFSLRIDVFSTEGKSAAIDFIEINPKKLNVNVVELVLWLVIPFAIMYATLELILDRKALMKDVRSMKRYKYLLYDLVTKDIKTKYRRSVLGVLWSVLNPLLMMLVLTAVFSNIIRVEVPGGFPLFYLTGYIMFNFVSEASNFSLYTITSAAPLIKKVYLPKFIFPLEKCIFSFVNMLFSLIAFVAVFFFFAFRGDVTPSVTMLMFPIAMILLFVFTQGLCFMLSSLVVFFRDVGHIWGIFLTVWMYASPIIYPISLVPEWLGNIIRLNPLYYYIDFFRNVMIYGAVPSASDVLVCIFYALAMFLVGTVVFRKSQDKFVLYI